MALAIRHVVFVWIYACVPSGRSWEANIPRISRASNKQKMLTVATNIRVPICAERKRRKYSRSLCERPFSSASAQLLNFPLPTDVAAVNCYLLLRQWQQQL